MKNRRSLLRLAGLALCLVLATGLLPTAWAAPTTVSYDISVQAKDGLGLNMRSGPGTEYPTVRSSLIPMYTQLHITQTDTSTTGALWGYTTYGGTSGWVCLVETTTYDPRPAQETAAPTETTEPGQTEPPTTEDTAQTQPETGETQAQPASQTNAVLIGVVIGLLAAILLVLVALLLRRKR